MKKAVKVILILAVILLVLGIAAFYYIKSIMPTDLIVHIREHLPILLGTRVTALRESKNRKAAK